MIESEHRLIRISDPSTWSLHTYFFACPESPDGEKVLHYAIADDRWSGQVMLTDRDGGNARPLGAPLRQPQLRPSFHTAAWQHWTPEGQAIVFRDGSMELYASEDSTPTVITPAGFIDPGGRWMLGSRYPASDNMPYRTAADLAAMYRIDAATGERTDLFTEKDLWPLHPAPEIAKRYRMVFKQVQWLPSGDRFMACYTNEEGVGQKPDGFEYLKSLFVADADGGNLRYLCEIGHHTNPTPDGKALLAYDDPRSVLREGNQGDWQNLVRVDVETGETRVIQEHVEGTHPSYSPDGKVIVTDIFVSGIYLVDPETGAMQQIVAFDRPKFEGDERGTHPHPVWSRDGNRVYFNCTESGLGQVYAVDVTKARTAITGRPVQWKS